MESDVLVSVIIPSFNRAQFIDRAVQSALSQTYSNLEVIVVDDGSKDETLGRVAALQKVDHRIRLISHNKNQGAQVARNTGIQEARGDYIAFLDSDNEWLPRKVEKQMALFSQKADSLGMVYCGFRRVFDDIKMTNEWLPQNRGNVYSSILRGWSADTSTLVINKDYLDKAGHFDESIRAYQEWELCIRLARVCGFDFVPECLVLYHQHNLPTISKNHLEGAWGYLDIVEKHRKEIEEECGTGVLSEHYMAAGRFFIRAGRLEIAKRLFLRSIKVSPKNYKAILSLGGTLLGIRGYLFMYSLFRTGWQTN